MNNSSSQAGKRIPFLSIVSARPKPASITPINNLPKRTKKRPFDGFTESDKETTKRVQELYSKKFSSKRVPQDIVASKVGWSQSTLNLYINGKQKIGDKALRKFCMLFNVTLDVISPDYHIDKFSSLGKPPATKELTDMRSVLGDLIEAIDGKRDLSMIIMRAKKCIVNE